MKNGWNGSVFVKNGKVQIKTTVTVGGYINVFNKDGKRVTLKKSGNKIVRSDTNEPVTTKGAYKVDLAAISKPITLQITAISRRMEQLQSME